MMSVSFLQPMALILFTLPLLFLIWGIVGYIIFKRVYIVLIITFAASTVFIFAYTGFDISNMYWVIAMTFSMHVYLCHHKNDLLYDSSL